MKIKKFLIFIVLLSSIIFLSACGDANPQIRIPADIVAANVKKIEEAKKQVNNVTIVNLGNYVTVDNSQEQNGLLVVEDTQGKKTVFSILTNKIMFPTEADLTISFFMVNYIGVYVKVVDSTGRTTIYDINGNLVLAKDDYYSYSVTSEVKNEDVNGENVNNYYEIVEFLTRVDQEKGSDKTKQRFKIDVKNKTKELVIEPDSEYYEDTIDRYDLTQFGLAGYYLKNIGDFIYVYNPKGKVIQTFNSTEFDTSFLLGRKIIVQDSYKVHFDSDKYSYIKDEVKYDLFTYQIDLVTGKKKQLNLDYKIISVEPILDRKGKYNYASVEIKEIVNKHLSTASKDALIGEKGKIISYFGDFRLNNVRKLNSKTYFDFAAGYLLNERLEPIEKLPFVRGIVPSEQLIIFKSGSHYGAINYEGKIIIPFEYMNLPTIFYEGKVVATHKNGNIYLIDTKGNITEFYGEYDASIVEGLLVKYIRSENRNIGIFYNYNLEEIERFSYDDELDVSTIFGPNRYNLYTSFIIGKVINGEKVSYIHIDISKG